MTDARIEAAARAIFAHYNPNDDFDRQFSYHKDADIKIAGIAIAAADAAACVRVVPMPISADRTEAAKNTLRCWKNGALTDEDAIGMIVCGVAMEQNPETITVPEVRNDRPIPGKGGVDGK